jgi:peptidyl-prolyl cis-trans isomerase SurA
LACFAGKANCAEKLIDRLLAEVNGEPVLLSEVQEKVDNGPLVVVSSYPASESDPAFKMALNDAINLKLIDQAALELGIEITDMILDEEIEKFLMRRNLDKAALMQVLQQQGITYERYREDFRSQMLFSQFQGRVIMPSVKITDKQIEAYYRSQQGGETADAELSLRQLFVALPANSPESIKAGKLGLLKQIRQELSDGLEFSKAVKLYSDSESLREKGGLMPSISLNDLAPAFRKAVESLEVSQSSEIVQTDAGYFIFYLEDKKFVGSRSFEAMKPKIESELRQKEISSETSRWIEARRRKSDVKILEK